MKKHSLFGLIFILVLGLLYTSSAEHVKNVNTDTFKEEDILLEAAETDGFKMEEFNIHTSTLIPDTFLTMEELEKKEKEILGALNIDGEIVSINVNEMYNSHHQDFFEDPLDIESETILEQRVEDNGYHEIIALIPLEDGNVILIKLLSTQILDDKETHIILDITQNKRYKEIVETNNRVKNILNKYGEKVETTINLTAAHEGKLTKVEEQQVQDEIFDFLKANKVEVLEDEFFTSITAYSPLIDSYINYDGKDVNLQLAMRYSKYEDKTYLWIANPLITTTY